MRDPGMKSPAPVSGGKIPSGGKSPPEGRNIRDTIVEARRLRLRAHGYAQGLSLPERRTVPLVPFSSSPRLICEIKRRSPSRGDIDAGLDPVERAGVYHAGGVHTFSVLTEEEFFGGSLADLMAVKSAFPEATVLRKDFLLDLEDVDVSFRAGADAILLIASVLDGEKLEALYRHARKLGLSVLVEVHTKEEVEKLRPLKPDWVGINARNLETFRTDLLHPLRIRGWIDWEAKVVFESGVRNPLDGGFVGRAGFEGLLVGEAVVRDPSTVPMLRSAYEEAYRNVSERAGKDCPPIKDSFWVRIAEAMERKRPLVKVCGITQPEDARLAVEAGADLLGFVFAPSPRRVDPSFVRELKDLEVLKVGVVVVKEPDVGAAGSPERVDPVLWAELSRLIQEGCLDALQIHWVKDPAASPAAGFPWPEDLPFYLAWNLRTSQELEKAFRGTPCPRFLVDASKEGMYGGTGSRVPDTVLASIREQGAPLWLAGGLRPVTIREVVERWDPELVDVSSGLEASPGRKDPERVLSFFKEIRNADSSFGR
ncbi:MAG: hypothetical protein Kow009_01810 [Spirochaetales bacterium]